jgi:hypothetical protein
MGGGGGGGASGHGCFDDDALTATNGPVNVPGMGADGSRDGEINYGIGGNGGLALNGGGGGGGGYGYAAGSGGAAIDGGGDGGSKVANNGLPGDSATSSGCVDLTHAPQFFFFFFLFLYTVHTRNMLCLQPIRFGTLS